MERGRESSTSCDVGERTAARPARFGVFLGRGIARPAVGKIAIALTLGITVGAAMTWAVPAQSSTPRAPVIGKTQATFTIPVVNGDSWRLQLWSSGTLDGKDIATSGTLIVPVPATASCQFQADVTVAGPNSQTYWYYSSARATVPGCGPPSTIAGHIYLCAATGAPTTTEIPAGTLAVTGPQTISPQPNPLSPTTVPAGSYTMTAGAPSGYMLVPCGGSAVVGSSGSTASESVVVPPGGSAVGIFYATAVAVPTAPSGVSTAPPAPSTTTSTKPPSAKPAALRQVSASSLAFTGMDMGGVVLVGILLLGLGTVATIVSRRLRRPLGSHRR
jgi:hypothetical protein